MNEAENLAGMDDEDIEWELSKMEEGDRRREAEWQQPEQPMRTVYRPVDPGLKARILRMFGQPHDESAIPKGQEFYLNGWDNGEEEEWKSAWKLDWGEEGNPLAGPQKLNRWPSRDGAMFPSRGDAFRPLSYTAGGNDVNTGGRGTDTAAANPYAGGYADGGAYGDMTLPEGAQQPGNNGSGTMAYPDLNDEQKLFIATVAGEAGGNGENAQRAVAHIIMNRVGHKRFNNYATVDKVITHPGQFDSYERPNAPYKRMTEYLKNRDGSDPEMERIINAVLNVYHRKEPDFTRGSVLFYSPKAQTELHGQNPQVYLAPRPFDWNWGELDEMDVPGVTGENFRFFRYK